ncbi:hypothetical protein CYMTET_20998 [Cymbomonas tetramitiformis]|uniref:Reverse transcriptase domain-containing protein n=1 Tax=Cymbomonas tetramitiformis TaxID=36881 RepID=A0AAE0G2W7_9CHLO|nr:hypothetical protein CYMTET_20998 [Cymbomonas tetramitiformis]
MFSPRQGVELVRFVESWREGGGNRTPSSSAQVGAGGPGWACSFVNGWFDGAYARRLGGPRVGGVGSPFDEGGGSEDAQRHSGGSDSGRSSGGCRGQQRQHGAVGVPEHQESFVCTGDTAVSGLEEEYRDTLAASQGRREGWSRERAMEAVSALVAEGARLRSILVANIAGHSGKRPWRALEAEEFEAMVWARPGLKAHGCGLDELPPAEEATAEDWWVLVQLSRERLSEMQRFCRGKGQGTYPDVVDDSFFRKQARSPSPDPMSRGAPRGQTALLVWGTGRDPPPYGCQTGRVGKSGGGPQDILAQAVHSGEVPDNIGGPSGVGILSGGLDTLSPVVPHQEGRKEPKDGCTTLLEWERGFWTMARTAPALQHKLFMYFHMWFVSKVAIYGFAAMAKFYDFFNLRMEADDFVSFKLGSYSDTFTAYLMKTNTQPQGGGGAAERDRGQARDGGGGCGPPPTEAAVEEQLRQEEEPVEELEGIEGEVLWLDLGETEELGGANRGDEMEITECWGRGLAPAARGVGWPFEHVDLDEPFRVPNYVGDEHQATMEKEIEKELSEARIFPAGDRLPLGISALGMVEKLRNGKIKYRPIWDYSRPAEVGVNDRIKLEKDKFSSAKNAYGLLRPGLWMIKADLDSPYRSVGVVSQFWPTLSFEFGGVRYFDVRAPFGNRALPGIFMRYTRAIVGWMQAQGVPAVGYLDDFFCVANSKEETEEIMLMLVEFVSLLGFKVNSAKCEGPGRRMEFLGVILAMDGERCTAEVNEERILFVLAHARDVERQATGFTLLAACGRRSCVKVSPAVLADIKVLERVIWLYNGRKVELLREDVKEDWFATDASGRKGMGGVLDKNFFLYSWDDMKRMVQRPWFPFQKGKKSMHHIIYLELFTVWWTVALWGPQLAGRTVVVRIDNQCALQHVDKLWGPVEYLPLLEQIFYVCVKYDVRLRPVYINTKDNLLTDLLSRLNLKQFHLEHRAFMRARIWRQDRDDWMLHPAPTHELDVEHGPFTLDALEVLEALQQKAQRYEEAALPDNTKGSYNTGSKAFITFCVYFACLGCMSPLLPSKDETLILFITFSSWDLTNLSLSTTILVGFFGLLRKDNLTEGKVGAWNSRASLVRDDVIFTEDGETVWLRVKYSETIQCGERAGDAALFVIKKGTGKKMLLVPLSHGDLVKGVKALAAPVGLDPGDYSGHSLRRGGATAALRLDVHSVYINLQGDWKSDCYSSGSSFRESWRRPRRRFDGRKVKFPFALPPPPAFMGEWLGVHITSLGKESDAHTKHTVR